MTARAESAQAGALTPSQIDDLAFGYVPSGKIGELREFAAALLDAAQPPAQAASVSAGDAGSLSEQEAFALAVKCGRSGKFDFRIPGTSRSHAVECAILEPADTLKFARALHASPAAADADPYAEITAHMTELAQFVDKLKQQARPAAADAGGLCEKPFMFAIMGPSGKVHMDETCVSEDAADLSEIVFYLNDEQHTGHYKVVPVYTRPAAVGAGYQSAGWFIEIKHGDGSATTITTRPEIEGAFQLFRPYVGGVRPAASGAADLSPEFYKGDRVRVTNEHGHIFSAVVTKTETRWSADRKPYLFYTVKAEGEDSKSIFPASALARPTATSAAGQKGGL